MNFEMAFGMAFVLAISSAMVGVLVLMIPKMWVVKKIGKTARFFYLQCFVCCRICYLF